MATLVVSQADVLPEANTRATIAFWFLLAAVVLSLLARVLPRMDLHGRLSKSVEQLSQRIRTSRQRAADEAFRSLHATSTQVGRDLGGDDDRAQLMTYWRRAWTAITS